MSNNYLRKTSNAFQDVRLVSLASWRQAAEISPRDRNGPYVVTQEAYDPDDAKMAPNEFVLAKSGQWLPLGQFFRMPVADRRDEFVFGTATEVMQTIRDLPSKAVLFGSRQKKESEDASAEPDEMEKAFRAAKKL